MQSERVPYHPKTHNTSPGMSRFLSRNLKHISTEYVTTKGMYFKVALRPLAYALYEVQESLISHLFNITDLDRKAQLPLFKTQRDANSLLFWLPGRLSMLESRISHAIVKRNQLAFQTYRNFWKYVVTYLSVGIGDERFVDNTEPNQEIDKPRHVCSLVSKAAELLTEQLRQGQNCTTIKMLTCRIWGLLGWILRTSPTELVVTQSVIADGLETYFGSGMQM